MRGDKDFWLDRWQQDIIGFHQQVPNQQLIQYFSHLKLAKKAKILVPLCGKSLDLIWLAQQGLQVVGVELSAMACEQFFSEHKLPMKLHQHDNFKVFCSDRVSIWCGDFLQLPTEVLGQVDAVYDRAALIALPQILRAQYVEKVASLLVPGGRLLLLTTEFPVSSLVGPPFAIFLPEINTLYHDQFTIKKVGKVDSEPPSHLANPELHYWRLVSYLLTKRRNQDL